MIELPGTPTYFPVAKAVYGNCLVIGDIEYYPTPLNIFFEMFPILEVPAIHAPVFIDINIHEKVLIGVDYSRDGKSFYYFLPKDFCRWLWPFVLILLKKIKTHL